MRKPLAAIALLGMLLAVVIPAAAQTVYKLIDRNGKVTYSEEPPKNFDGKVIRIDIDPNANRATLGVPPPAAKPGADTAKPAATPPAKPAAPSAEDRLEEARQKLEDRQRELADARDNPREGEIQWIGNKGGGTRAVPTDAYQQRLAGLERAVKEAEDEVHELEKHR
jgi:hypothetical protein